MLRMHEMDEKGNTLDSLLVAYREAYPDRDASADFMPRLWQKIEARRVETTSIFKRFAQACVAATAVLLILTTMMMPSTQDSEVYYSSTYSDVLVADHADQTYVQALPAALPGVN